MRVPAEVGGAEQRVHRGTRPPRLKKKVAEFTWIKTQGFYLRHIRNLCSVYKLNTGGGATKGVGAHALGPRVPVYAKYEICGSVYKLNTGGGTPLPAAVAMAVFWRPTARAEGGHVRAMHLRNAGLGYGCSYSTVE